MVITGMNDWKPDTNLKIERSMISNWMACFIFSHIQWKSVTLAIILCLSSSLWFFVHFQLLLNHCTDLFQILCGCFLGVPLPSFVKLWPIFFMELWVIICKLGQFLKTFLYKTNGQKWFIFGLDTIGESPVDIVCSNQVALTYLYSFGEQYLLNTISTSLKPLYRFWLNLVHIFI